MPIASTETANTKNEMVGAILLAVRLKTCFFGFSIAVSYDDRAPPLKLYMPCIIVLQI